MRKITVHSLNRNGIIVSFLLVLMAALSATARAQCGGSFGSMAAAAASIQSQSLISQSSAENTSTATNEDERSSIVGLWHIRFLVGNQTIQEAFQIWNDGGTEVHNPNVDPRLGNVCLGAWKEEHYIFRLAHRVWNYNSGGIFMGTINLSETVVVGNNGTTQSGSFRLAFYDPSGHFLFEVPGTVVGERISVD